MSSHIDQILQTFDACVPDDGSTDLRERFASLLAAVGERAEQEPDWYRWFKLRSDETVPLAESGCGWMGANGVLVWTVDGDEAGPNPRIDPIGEVAVKRLRWKSRPNSPTRRKAQMLKNLYGYIDALLKRVDRKNHFFFGLRQAIAYVVADCSSGNRARAEQLLDFIELYVRGWLPMGREKKSRRAIILTA